MIKGRLLAVFIVTATVLLIVVGTLRPVPSAVAYAGGRSLLRPSSTPEGAVENLADEIRLGAWEKGYSRLGNKAKFTESDFVHDLTGYHPSLRTYASLDSFEVHPLHASANEAEVQLRLRWSTVVGSFLDARNLHVVRNGDRWEPEWPIVKEPLVPPQVITANYLRWDVIYPGPGDDWGAQDVEAPHVRIVDMRPVERSDGTLILGELLNEDVVPAWVSVTATLQAKNGSAIATEGSLDKISHLLLPKQVTPFLIAFPSVTLSEVGSIHMEPLSTLVSAAADPVIGIQNQRLNQAPGTSLSGELVNQSGRVVNIAHVLGTFYDKTGQLVWVADEYIDRALLPQTPVPFDVRVPQDLARKISSERAVTATFSYEGFQ